jgi:hypothetical protein
MYRKLGLLPWHINAANEGAAATIRASERISTGISLRPRIISVLRRSASVELLITFR